MQKSINQKSKTEAEDEVIEATRAELIAAAMAVISEYKRKWFKPYFVVHSSEDDK